jgi:hypothetical protein
VVLRVHRGISAPLAMLHLHLRGVCIVLTAFSVEVGIFEVYECVGQCVRGGLRWAVRGSLLIDVERLSHVELFFALLVFEGEHLLRNADRIPHMRFKLVFLVPFLDFGQGQLVRLDGVPLFYPHRVVSRNYLLHNVSDVLALFLQNLRCTAGSEWTFSAEAFLVKDPLAAPIIVLLENFALKVLDSHLLRLKPYLLVRLVLRGLVLLQETPHASAVNVAANFCTALSAEEAFEQFGVNFGFLLIES